MATKPKKTTRRPCDRCQIAYINGVRCHETGCPDAWKDEVRECRECGTGFAPKYREQTCCSPECRRAFYFLADDE